MVEKTVEIALTAVSEERPVAVLVQLASQFDSKIHLISGNKKINAKSIMGMMSLGFAEANLLLFRQKVRMRRKPVNSLLPIFKTKNNPMYISLFIAPVILL